MSASTDGIANDVKSKPYTVRRADFDEEMCRFLDSLFNREASAECKEKYTDNPAGMGVCLLLESDHSDRSVGVQCIAPRRFVVGEGIVSGGILADYFVEPLHRSLGPALTLMKATLAVGQDALDFVYGFPNEKAEVICRRVGAPPLGRLGRYVKPLRSGAFVSEALSDRLRWLKWLVSGAANIFLALENFTLAVWVRRGLSWKHEDDFDELLDECWAGSNHGDWLIGERSSEILRWRYPAGGARRISVALDQRTGRYEGYVVWRHGDNTIEIMDFFCRDPRKQLFHLLGGFSHHVANLKAYKICLEFLGPEVLVSEIVKAGFRSRHSNPVILVSAKPQFGSHTLESAYLTSFDRDTD